MFYSLVDKTSNPTADTGTHTISGSLLRTISTQVTYRRPNMIFNSVNRRVASWMKLPI